MTEEQWQTCTDPKPMIEYLRDKTIDRRSRLLAAACCRRIWSSMTDQRSRNAVEVAERFADGDLSDEDCSKAFSEAYRAIETVETDFVNHSSGNGTFDPTDAAADAAANAASCAAFPPHSPSEKASCLAHTIALPAAARVMTALHGFSEEARKNEEIVQCGIIRDIFGPLLFRPVTLDPALLKNDAVVEIARRAYDHRRLPEGTLDPSRLGALADALEAAGCCDAEVLTHLRDQANVHVRGCWPVDLLLQKS